MSRKYIYIVFDKYFSPFKDYERANRQREDTPYAIVGPQQNRPDNFLESLKNFKFKEALVRFLGEHWKNNNIKSLLGTKAIFLTMEELYFSYSQINEMVLKTQEDNFRCYEEADTNYLSH